MDEWIPACAGMTAEGATVTAKATPKKLPSLSPTLNATPWKKSLFDGVRGVIHCITLKWPCGHIQILP